MSEQNEKNQIEELEAPAHELTEEEAREVEGGLSAGKVSMSDFSLAPQSGGSSAAGSGMGAGKVVLQDFH